MPYADRDSRNSALSSRKCYCWLPSMWRKRTGTLNALCSRQLIPPQSFGGSRHRAPRCQHMFPVPHRRPISLPASSLHH
jgi:hypothetical protein